MRTRSILAALDVGSGLVSASFGEPTAQDLVGTWRLVSASASTETGQVNAAPYGARPTGTVTYTANGRVTLMISYSDRVPLTGADRIASSAEERAEAFRTFFAYAGRYSVSGDAVTHHVEISSVPNWVGTDLTRVLSVVGNRLVLKTPPLSVGGSIQATELVWERVE
jgi:hypothetical protein